MTSLSTENISLWFDNNLDINNRTIYMGSIRDPNGIETGVDTFMAECFIKGMYVLESKNKTPINIIMNNPGGDWYHGMAIYDAIQNSKSQCSIKVYGYAMSMGSIILQAANHRIMMPNSRFMIHNGTHSYNDMSLPLTKKWVREEERINDDMEEIYLKSMLNKEKKEGTGYLIETLSTILDKRISKKQDIRGILKEMLNFDTILSAKETVALGFADEIYKIK